MSNLSFIPSVAAKPDQDFQQMSLPEKNTFKTGSNSFEQFLKSATDNKFKTEPLHRQPKQTRSVANKANQNSIKDPAERANQDRPEKTESEPKQDLQGTAVDDPKTTAETEQANNSDEKTAVVEDQNQENPKGEEPSVSNQTVMAIIANLVETEAIVEGELTPETVQMTELTEILADSTSAQVITAVDGKKLEEAKPVEIGAELSGANVEKTTDVFGAIIEDLKGEQVTTSTDQKAVNLEELNQVLPQISGEAMQSEEESLSNQSRNQDGKDQIKAAVKVEQNVGPVVEKGSQSNKPADGEVFLPKPDLTVESQPVKDRVMAQHDQPTEKNGKINLAVIQTQLAVKDIPEVKTETPVLSIVSSQPSINNLSQTQTASSTEVNSASREELFSQIVEHAKVLVNNGGSEMEVNLRPEHLGKLQLKVTIENEVVTAKFVAESQQVKEIIESNLSQLKRNLQESGMQVDTIMVSVANHQNNQNFDQTAYSQEGRGGYNNLTADATEDQPLETEDHKSVAHLDTVIDLIA